MPDAPAPRLMTRSAFRAYTGGLPWAEIELRMTSGRLPGPVWGLLPADPRARWDRRAVDRALDAASGMPATVEQHTDLLDRALGTR